MSFTPTPNYALQKPTVTTEIDAWGDDLNANWDIVDTRMKLNADAAAAASALAATKANATHTHNAGTDLTGTVPAAQMPAHTGDVTSPAGSVVNTIAANAVVTAKILDAMRKNMRKQLLKQYTREELEERDLWYAFTNADAHSVHTPL